MRPARPGIANVAVFIIGGLLFAFVCAKATVSSFTHDESYTYLHYPHTGVLAILSFSDWYPNNHILNSLLMKFSEKLFGASELALRLPNLVLLVVYMFYGRMLFSKGHPILAVALFVMLCTNRQLMDLFGLARGYGLSCGFMMMSLYHAIRFLQNGRRVHLLVFHGVALLASLSNFTLLIFYTATLASCVMIQFLQGKVSDENGSGFLASVKGHFLPLVVSAMILYEPVRRLTTRSDLDFGGNTGFFADTVSDVVANALHGVSIPPMGMMVVQAVFVAIVLASLILNVTMIVRKGTGYIGQWTGLVASNLVVMILPIVIVLQHVILGSDYPVARFSAFLFPLFIVHLGFLCQFLLSLGLQRVLLPIVVGLAVASTISFGNRADLYASAEWRYDMHTKDMIRALVAHHDAYAPDEREVSLGINWLFEPTINYYRVTRGLNWLMPVDRNGPTGQENYLYVFGDDPINTDTARYEKVVAYEDIHTILLCGRSYTR